MMKCTKCGVENTTDAKFCKSCGEGLDVEPQSAPSNEMTVVSDQFILNRYLVKKRFRVLRKLGIGGMGEVFLAEDVKLKRLVAVKSILLKDNLAETTSKMRFLREAQTASQLDHPNICTIYEIYEEEDVDYIVMQYIDGVTMDQIIGAKRLSINKILDVAIQMCSGMIEAHSKEIIHRDIKPGNIMVDRKGTVKILDFGLAKFTADSTANSQSDLDSNLTEKGFVMGTVAYISPEQARGKTLDHRSDIFSFGTVLFEMIEGQNPFREEGQIETLYNVLNKDIEFTREIPKELDAIVRKALEKSKDDRYSDFEKLRSDLDTFRMLYNQEIEDGSLQDEKDGGHTEIINVDEHARLMEESQKSTTDKENLGELVYRIKKSKASTERMLTTNGPRLKVNKVLLIILAVVIIAASSFLLLNKTSDKNGTKDSIDEKTIDKTAGKALTAGGFYIYLNHFKVTGNEKKMGNAGLTEKLDYLLTECLNQFEEFKIIDINTALYIAGKEDKNGNRTVIDFNVMKDKFDIRYELTGNLEKSGKGYNIEAFLKPYGKDEEPYRIAAPGLNMNAILETQVDIIVDGIYRHLQPEKAKNLEIKESMRIYGDDWQAFSRLYNGIKAYRDFDYTGAEPIFNNESSLLVSKYYLAEILYFDGRRKQSKALIDEMIPRIDTLTPVFKLHVQALKARLEFNFKEEVRYREQLAEDFSHSREMFYELGEAYFHHANPEKAIIFYRKALELDKNYSNALNHIGYCYSYLGEHGKSIEAFQLYQRLDNSVNSYDSLGDGYFYVGNLKLAESWKKNAAQQSKGKIAYPYQTLADIYILKTQYEKAVDALHTYHRLKKEKNEGGVTEAQAYVQSKIALIHYQQKQYREALRYIKLSLQLYDNDNIIDSTAEEHWLKGVILLALGNEKEAEVELEWLRIFKNTWKLDRDNFNAALKYFIHLEALILEKKGKSDQAMEKFKELIAMKSRLSYWITYYYYQYFHTEYATFLHRNGYLGQALEELDRCLEFNDDYIPALKLKEELLLKLNKPEAAAKVKEKLKKQLEPL